MISFQQAVAFCSLHSYNNIITFLIEFTIIMNLAKIIIFTMKTLILSPFITILLETVTPVLSYAVGTSGFWYFKLLQLLLKALAAFLKA